jgi:addiction module HigA family antidote
MLASVIQSFHDQSTAQLFQRRLSRRFPPNLRGVPWRKLAVRHAVERLDDLRVPPGNRLEKLSGDREGQYRMRIHERWRLGFRWHEGQAYDVESTAYHEEAMMSKKFAPIAPGEILLEEFLKPLGMSQYRVARDIGVHPRRINEIVHGKRAISADTTLRLARYFSLSERFWRNLQAHDELEREKDRRAGRLETEMKVLARAQVAPMRV